MKYVDNFGGFGLYVVNHLISYHPPLGEPVHLVKPPLRRRKGACSASEHKKAATTRSKAK